MVSVRKDVEVEVDVDLNDFDNDELVEHLQDQGYRIEGKGVGDTDFHMIPPVIGSVVPPVSWHEVRQAITANNTPAMKQILEDFMYINNQPV